MHRLTNHRPGTPECDASSGTLASLVPAALLAVAALGITLAFAFAPPTLSADVRDDGRGQQLDPELARLYADTRVNPFDAVDANNLAMKLVARGEYEKARKLLRRAMRLAPNRLEISRNADNVQRLIEQHEQLSARSKEHFRGSFDVEAVPFIADAWTSVGDASISDPVETPSATDERTRTADNPFDTDWLLERASLKASRGEHRAALVDLERARTLDPYLSGLEAEISRLRRLLPDGGEHVRPSDTRRSNPGGWSDDDLELPRPWGTNSVPDSTGADA